MPPPLMGELVIAHLVDEVLGLVHAEPLPLRAVQEGDVGEEDQRRPRLSEGHLDCWVIATWVCGSGPK